MPPTTKPCPIHDEDGSLSRDHLINRDVVVYKHGNVLHQGSRKDETEILFGLVCEACYKRGKIVLAEAEEITIGGTCLGYKHPLPGPARDFLVLEEDHTSASLDYRTVGLRVAGGSISPTLRFIKARNAHTIVHLKMQLKHEAEEVELKREASEMHSKYETSEQDVRTGHITLERRLFNVIELSDDEEDDLNRRTATSAKKRKHSLSPELDALRKRVLSSSTMAALFHQSLPALPSPPLPTDSVLARLSQPRQNRRDTLSIADTNLPSPQARSPPAESTLTSLSQSRQGRRDVPSVNTKGPMSLEERLEKMQEEHLRELAAEDAEIERLEHEVQEGMIKKHKEELAKKAEVKAQLRKRKEVLGGEA